MEEIRLPHSGWGKGTVPVSHAPDHGVTVVEIKGGVLSPCYVYGLIDTPDRLEQGDMLVTTNFGGHRARGVVPREYTHLSVKGGMSTNLPRWRVGFRTADSLSELVESAEGRHPDVVPYNGARTTVRLEVGNGHADITHRPLNGGGETLLHLGQGPFRGTIELPGPGLIDVDCLVRWSITVPGGPTPM
ncbi:hypothetical protein [Streptomyces sp. NBC_01506]|uniref:hypothetical protein n=1 Tax=Streptomyces sp. NBC_01506 TaxID=2903887 RepID=UPI00386DA2AE